MADINVYGYATSLIVDDFHVIIVDALQAYTPTQFIMANTAGIFTDKLVFIGNFTVGSFGISGGAITELKVESASGTLETDITGISVSISNGSFNSGAFLAPGSTYHDMTGNSSLEGYGNDTYYTGGQTTILPGGGVNTIYGAGTGVRVLFTGSFSNYSLSTASDGSVLVLDSNASRNGYNDITGSATLKFEGDQTIVQDLNGALSLNATAATANSYASSSTALKIAVTDSAANVAAYLDSLQSLLAAGHLGTITLTDSATPAITVTAAQFANDLKVLQDISSSYTLAVTGLTANAAVSALAAGSIVSATISDSATNVLVQLDSLESYVTGGKVGAITLTDIGIPTLAVTPAQSVQDAAALAAITSSYVLNVSAGATSQTIDGAAGHGSVVLFGGTASQYSIASSGTGTGVTVGNGIVTDHVNGVTALHFSDLTDFVASQTPAVPGGVSSFQVATLYAAVLARTPDVAGLAYYENLAATNSAIPITTYAQWFLQSPEYTGNAAHNYAQTAAGDAQFITDTYHNLLHRDPGSGDAAWYQTNVIAPILGSAAPGTSAYTAAELVAHASVLADFSQSAEFRSDVQVTAQAPSSAQHWLVLV